jgi:hypothetical protein
VPTRLSARQRDLLRELAKVEAPPPAPGDRNFFQKVKDLFS